MILRKTLAVLVCLSALAGTAHAQGDGKPQQGDGQQQKPQAEQPVAPPAQPVIRAPASQPQAPQQSPPQAKVDEGDSAKAEKRAEADLEAQRRMAQAAEDALYYSRLQLWTNAVGLFVVIGTLGITAWTGNAARVAAQAAVDAVASERAWMTIEGAVANTATNLHDDNGVNHGNGGMISVAWLNTGRSPALNARADFNFAIQAINSPERNIEKKFDHNNAENPPLFPLAPQQGTHTPPIWLIGQDFSDFVKGVSEILIYAYMEYNTSFSASTYFTKISGRIVCTGSDPDNSGRIVKLRVVLYPTGNRNSVGIVEGRPPFRA